MSPASSCPLGRLADVSNTRLRLSPSQPSTSAGRPPTFPDAQAGRLGHRLSLPASRPQLHQPILGSTFKITQHVLLPRPSAAPMGAEVPPALHCTGCGHSLCLHPSLWSTYSQTNPQTCQVTSILWSTPAAAPPTEAKPGLQGALTSCPHSLCSCWSLLLEGSFQCPHGALTSFRSLLKCHLLREAFPDLPSQHTEPRAVLVCLRVTHALQPSVSPQALVRIPGFSSRLCHF